MLRPASHQAGDLAHAEQEGLPLSGDSRAAF